MGAKARIWCNRCAVVLAVLVGLAALWTAPVPVGFKVCLTLVAAIVAGEIAFRHVPAFDPLGRIAWRLPGRLAGGKTCAITFDDGPSPATAQVLDVLAQHHVRATFFVLAANASRHPEVVRRLVGEGHTIAVHGNSHRKLHQASEAEIETEIRTAQATLQGLGIEPAPIYRSPHGLKNRRLFRVTRRLGLQLWAWSRGIWDTDRPPAETLVARATRFARDGMVLLLHDGRGDELAPDVSRMVEALPHILGELQRRQFAFATLATVDRQPMRSHDRAPADGS
jgi:peptidoglycan/xylan/chitin deacetylase (PgdA/CDA1 family)